MLPSWIIIKFTANEEVMNKYLCSRAICAFLKRNLELRASALLCKLKRKKMFQAKRVANKFQRLALQAPSAKGNKWQEGFGASPLFNSYVETTEPSVEYSENRHKTDGLFFSIAK